MGAAFVKIMEWGSRERVLLAGRLVPQDSREQSAELRRPSSFSKLDKLGVDEDANRSQGCCPNAVTTMKKTGNKCPLHIVAFIAFSL